MKIRYNICCGIICFLITMFVGGCGTPEAEKLADKLYSIDFSSVSAEIFIEGELSANINGNNLDAEIKNDYSFILDVSENNTDEYMATMVNKNHVNLFELIKNDANCTYYYKNGTVYADRNEAFYQADDDKMRKIICKETLNKLKLDLVNVLYKSEVLDETKKYGSEECYILEYTLEGNELYKYLADIASVINEEDKFKKVFEILNIQNEVSAYELFSYMPVRVQAAVSCESGYLVGLDFDFSGIDSEGMLEYLSLDTNELFKMLSIDFSELSVKDLYLGMNFFEYDNSAVEFPEELENALKCDKKDFYELTFSDSEVLKEFQDDDLQEKSDEEDDIDINEDDIDINGEDLSGVTPYAEDVSTVTLYDENGIEICDVNVPEELKYYKVYSDDTSINLMNDEGNIDCYVSSSLEKGYGGEYLNEYLTKGSYSENFTIVDEKLKIGTIVAKRIIENDSDKIYIVFKMNNSDIVISFGPGISDDTFKENVIPMLEEMFE